MSAMTQYIITNELMKQYANDKNLWSGGRSTPEAEALLYPLDAQ